MTATVPPATRPVEVGTPPAGPARSGRARSERRLGWMLCAPAVTVMLLVTAYPIVYAIFLSLQRSDLRFPDQAEFVGLRNYVDVLTSQPVVVRPGHHPGHHRRLRRHRARPGDGPGPAHAPGHLRPAHGAGRHPHPLRHRHRGRRPGLALRLRPHHRVRQRACSTPTGRGSRSGRRRCSSIILTEVWKTTPFMALLLLAGLTLVPDDLHRAARVDGATTWQRFTQITLPLMKPAILVAVLFRTLDAFRDLRLGVRHDRGRQRHRDGVDPGVEPARSTGSTWASARPCRC